MAVATRVSDEARGYFIGTYAGTTAAQNIHIGFKPALIIAVNVTDGDTVYVWSKVSETTVVSLKGADAALATESIAIARVDNGTVLGFSLPSNAVVNEDAKVYLILALPE